jgi:EAL domain-containing protein (putative c-di-GMP-specific phosphodiesterase class I)
VTGYEALARWKRPVRGNIPPSVFISDRDHALHVLRQIKALGVGVAMDDFGTGYSSLETLRDFPFDKIKLAGFFMSRLTDRRGATASFVTPCPSS